jgi:transcription antitermination factor NusG
MCTDGDGVCAGPSVAIPTVMIRLQDNPPMTWPAATSLIDLARPWAVAYCKPRQEKALGWDLCRREIAYFLPMVLRETSSGGRRRRNYYPLFPSYLFFAGDDQERLAVLRTDRVTRLIDISECEQSRFRQEISALDTAIRHFPKSIELYPRLVPGTRVRITSGPMKDVEGVVVQSQNMRKLLLSVSVLGVGATVEIHADLVEAK